MKFIELHEAHNEGEDQIDPFAKEEINDDAHGKHLTALHKSNMKRHESRASRGVVNGQLEKITNSKRIRNNQQAVVIGNKRYLILDPSKAAYWTKLEKEHKDAGDQLIQHGTPLDLIVKRVDKTRQFTPEYDQAVLRFLKQNTPIPFDRSTYGQTTTAQLNDYCVSYRKARWVEAEQYLPTAGKVGQQYWRKFFAPHHLRWAPFEAYVNQQLASTNKEEKRAAVSVATDFMERLKKTNPFPNYRAAALAVGSTIDLITYYKLVSPYDRSTEIERALINNTKTSSDWSDVIKLFAAKGATEHIALLEHLITTNEDYSHVGVQYCRDLIGQRMPDFERALARWAEPPGWSYAKDALMDYALIFKTVRWPAKSLLSIFNYYTGYPINASFVSGLLNLAMISGQRMSPTLEQSIVKAMDPAAATMSEWLKSEQEKAKPYIRRYADMFMNGTWQLCTDLGI